MKKYLYMLLAAAVLCGCEEESKLNPNLLPKEEEEVWVETGEVFVENVVQEGNNHPAGVVLNVRIKGYMIYNHMTVRIVNKSDKILYLLDKEYQNTLETEVPYWDRDIPSTTVVPLQPQQGTFDFVLEFPRPDKTETRSFRTKVWRITMSQTDGVWSVDDLSLVPGQE